MLLREMIERMNDIFEGGLSGSDELAYARHLKGKLMESQILVEQARNNTKQQFDGSSDLAWEIMNAIIDTFDAHATMSSRLLTRRRAGKGSS